MHELEIYSLIWFLYFTFCANRKNKMTRFERPQPSLQSARATLRLKIATSNHRTVSVENVSVLVSSSQLPFIGPPGCRSTAQRQGQQQPHNGVDRHKGVRQLLHRRRCRWKQFAWTTGEHCRCFPLQKKKKKMKTMKREKRHQFLYPTSNHPPRLHVPLTLFSLPIHTGYELEFVLNCMDELPCISMHWQLVCSIRDELAFVSSVDTPWGLFTLETNWNSSWIEGTNCHAFQWQFVYTPSSGRMPMRWCGYIPLWSAKYWQENRRPSSYLFREKFGLPKSEKVRKMQLFTDLNSWSGQEKKAGVNRRLERALLVQLQVEKIHFELISNQTPK